MGGRKKESAEEIEARLTSGDWLTPGAVATLLGVDRGTVVYWLSKGHTPTRLPLTYRLNALNGYRECNPKQVARILAAQRGTSADQSER